MANIETPESLGQLPVSVIKNMIALATSGFGVVVALAWNEFIKATVDNYINPILGANGSMISLFVYAAIMTFLAVVVTMQLALLQKKFELLQENLAAKQAMASAFAQTPAKKPRKKKKQ